MRLLKGKEVTIKVDGTPVTIGVDANGKVDVNTKKDGDS